MATAWIHRAFASDILVTFKTHREAWYFCVDFINSLGPRKIDDELNEWNPESSEEEIVGTKQNVQLICYPGCRLPHAHPGNIPWNPSGMICLNSDEAMALGERGEPDRKVAKVVW
jgi:hypothetical protein